MTIHSCQDTTVPATCARYTATVGILSAGALCNKACCVRPEGCNTIEVVAKVSGRVIDERATFDQAIALNPHNGSYFFSRWMCYFRLQDYERALQEINQAIEHDPEKGLYYHGRGYVSLHQGKLDEGQADFLLARQYDPDSVSSGWMVQWCDLIAQPDWDGVVQALRTLAPQESTDPLAPLCQGVAYWLSGDFSEAASVLEQALVSQPENEDVSFWLGMAYASLGRDGEAKEALERALSLQLPHVLLQTLALLKEQNPVFFQEYALPLVTEKKID